MTQDLSRISSEQWVQFLLECAQEAKDIALHYFNLSTLQVEIKSDNSPVSQGDTELETLLRRHVESKFPTLSILGEEHGQCPLDAPFKFIIDPIDGTSNFIRGIPFFGTLLAIEIHGELVAGLISAPATGDMWWAGKGQGAFHNGKRCQVSKISTLAESQAFYGSLYGREARGNTPQLLQLLSKTKRQRGLGDFLMHTYVAMGCGEFGVDFGLKPWDIAPLGVIIPESGGTITHLDGSPFTAYGQSIVTSNGLLHQDVLGFFN